MPVTKIFVICFLCGQSCVADMLFYVAISFTLFYMDDAARILPFAVGLGESCHGITVASAGDVVMGEHDNKRDKLWSNSNCSDA